MNELGRPQLEVQCSGSVFADALNFQVLDDSINCFHSIFGAHFDDIEVKGEPEDFALNHKLTITDLEKNESACINPGYSIEYVRRSPGKEILCKPEQFFDKATERKRLKCPNCYFLTGNKGNLKQHMKIHQRPEGGTLFHCEFCTFKTKYKNSIQGHVFRHKQQQQSKNRKGKKRRNK